MQEPDIQRVTGPIAVRLTVMRLHRVSTSTVVVSTVAASAVVAALVGVPALTSALAGPPEPAAPYEVADESTDQVAAGACQNPSQLLDLTNWKIQLPIGADESPDEVVQPELDTYQVDPWFVPTPNCDGIQFRSAVNGVTTGGSSYPRSELREMNGGDEAAWSSTDGTHTMTIDQTVTHLPNEKQHMVVGQIHGGDDDVSVFRVEGTSLYVTNGDDTHYQLVTDNFALNKRFQVQFVVADGTITHYYNGEQVASLDADFSTGYFKAGAYTQANCENSSPCDETNYGETIIHDVRLGDGAEPGDPTPGPEPTDPDDPSPSPEPTDPGDPAPEPEPTEPEPDPEPTPDPPDPDPEPSPPKDGSLKVCDVTAGGDDGNGPQNTVDNDLGTRWWDEGDDNEVWIKFDLCEPVRIDHLDIAWYKGDQVVADFDVQTSSDGENWTNRFPDGESSGDTRKPERVELDDHEARYLRIVGFGNGDNDWTSITEVDIYAP